MTRSPIHPRPRNPTTVSRLCKFVEPPWPRQALRHSNTPLIPKSHIPLATTRRTHSTRFSRFFAFIIVLCFRGVFEGARHDIHTLWNYPYSSIQPFLRRESQLPPASASVLVVLSQLRVLRVLRVSVRYL